MFQHIESGEARLSQEERENQLEKMIMKIKELDDEAFLDIADHIHWGVLQFYKPSVETPIPNKILKKIQEKNPELLL